MSKVIKVISEAKEYGIINELGHLVAYLRLKRYNNIQPIDGKRQIYFEKISQNKQKRLIEYWFYYKTRRKMSIDTPKNYNEKIQWLKYYDRDPRKTILADKYAVREWVKVKIGEEYLIPLLGVWNSFEDILFDELPNQFVLKCNHGSGYNYIVTDKEEIDYTEAKEKFIKWMKEDFAFKSGFELHYIGIPRRIIAEKYIENASGDLYDYKFFCFKGKARLILFINNRGKGLEMSLFDMEWNLLELTYGFPKSTSIFTKPDNLDEMIDLAEELSKDFEHVRVDFYRTDDGKIYFGEMTFSSFNGLGNWQPEWYNKWLGDFITCI